MAESVAIEKFLQSEPEMCWKCMGPLIWDDSNGDERFYTCSDCGWKVSWIPPGSEDGSEDQRYGIDPYGPDTLEEARL